MSLVAVSDPKAPLSSCAQVPGLNIGRPSFGGKVKLPLLNKGSSFSIVCRVVNNVEVKPKVIFGRKSFPPGFTFGAASSTYQIEGGWNEGGRGPSIWDNFTHNHPEKIDDHKNGDVTVDSYHRYKDDVKLLKNMGMDAYRFSISWSRILPKGTLEGGINQEGIDYYNNLINELLDKGIKPFVTLFHWDVPQSLEDEYGGFLDRKIVNDFKDYCEVCFKEFGDRVKHWITLNEPWTFSSLGYGLGSHAPGRCSEVLGCTVGDSLKEPYIVTHNLILAHAAAFRLYKDNFKATQKGDVGITLVCQWFKPYSSTRSDREAADRALDFMVGWYMEPLVYGDYPFSMRAIVRQRLPYFTDEETKMVKGSYDFIGVNYYTGTYARSLSISPNFIPVLSIQESYAEQFVEKDGVPIGKLEGTWIYVYPQGMKELLVFMKERYNSPTIYITENGTSEIDNTSTTLGEALDDELRIAYYARHLNHVQEAIKSGVDVKGFFAWSLTDNFEWEKGFTQRFGLHYVDYKNNLKRYPKDSTKWFTKFLNA